MSGGLRPFFCYYGGKWRVAPRYPAPVYETIVEPFAGSAGYATRYAGRRVVLVEKDPVIAGLWAYLTRVSAEEIRRIPLLADGETVDDLYVCPEAKALVGFWLNKGTAAPCKTPSAWMREPGSETQFWGEAVRAMIASQVEQIRHWTIINGSYDQAPDVKATWFVDQPYQKMGRHYRHSSAALDFSALGSWVHARQGRVIVCEQEGADWLPFGRPFSIKANESKHGKGRSSEVMWFHDTDMEAA